MSAARTNRVIATEGNVVFTHFGPDDSYHRSLAVFAHKAYLRSKR